MQKNYRGERKNVDKKMRKYNYYDPFSKFAPSKQISKKRNGRESV